MERLTIPDKKIEAGFSRTLIDTRAVKENAMTLYWALKKYEDTGLTPEEILDGKLLTGWIPVTEKLPTSREFKIKAGNKTLYITVIAQTSMYHVCAAYYNIAERKWFNEEKNEIDVVAWMPTPKLYVPEQED